MATKGIYIYGIVPNFYSGDMFRSLDNSDVYAIPYQNISAIVSDHELSRLDSLDREALGQMLVLHQKTIEELQRKQFNLLIPMRLGTIMGSKEEVIKILANGYDLVLDTFKKIEFLIEVDLAVTWADFSVTISEIASLPDVVALKEEIMQKSNPPSQIDQVSMGMMIESKLKENNSNVELNILDILSPISLDIKTHEVMNDQMVSNAAFLISKSKLEKFEHAIEHLDEEWGGKLNFKIVGPLPCYSFFTLELKELDIEIVTQARVELGLGEETSEVEIKKVYLEKAKLFHPDVQQESGSEEKFSKINKAYHTLLDYSVAARQSSKDDLISLNKEKVRENLILIKIKE
ncbi:MAG: GvpL/GvpF family gas vesicle protein [Bacteroidota bacterium]